MIREGQMRVSPGPLPPGPCGAKLTRMCFSGGIFNEQIPYLSREVSVYCWFSNCCLSEGVSLMENQRLLNR